MLQAQHFIPRPFHTGAANMNPVASHFVPADSLQTRDGSEPEVLALIRVLTTEQRAHEATQASLQTACARLVDVETQLNKLENQNKSLTSTVKMLKSIIKNQQGKIQESSSSLNKSSDEDIAAGAETKGSKSSNCILYDVVARQRAEYENDTACSSSESINSSDIGLRKKPDSQLNDSQVFDLDLLRSPHPHKSRCSKSGGPVHEETTLDSGEIQHVVSQTGSNNKVPEQNLIGFSTSSQGSYSAKDGSNPTPFKDERFHTQLQPRADSDPDGIEKAVHGTSTTKPNKTACEVRTCRSFNGSMSNDVSSPRCHIFSW